MARDKHGDKSKQRPAGDAEGAVREIPVSGPETGQVEAAEPSEADTLRARCAELEDQKLRALAELDNSRKRMARQIEDIIRTANDRLLAELLEVADNLERALAHGNAGNSEECNNDAVFEGTRLILSQVIGLLDKYGVRPLESIGKRFDPTYHEALMEVDSDVYEPGVVAAEMVKGYAIGDRILRHARVAVSRGRLSTGEDATPKQ